MPGSRRVLLVDDDAMFRASLAEQLRAGDAYEPVEVGTAEQGVAEGLDGHYEFLVVDSDLPDGDGCDVVRNLRKGGVNAPIILLWEQDGGFAPSQECGADDVLVKPIRLAVLLARAGARARSHKRSSDEEARIGPYVFRPHAKVLTDRKSTRLNSSH